MTNSDSKSNRDKLQVFNLSKECDSMKLDLLTNATVIYYTTTFIAVNTENRKEKR